MSQVLDPLKVRRALARSTCGVTAEQLQEMASMYARQYTCRALGEMHGLSPCTVRRLLVMAGVTMRPAHPISLFTPEFVHSIHVLREQGLTWERVAERMGVCQTTIVKARKRGDV